MIQPWEVYEIFNALKLHFTSNYDAVKYQYKTKANKASFLKRNDRFFFAKLGKKYNRTDLHNLILVNMIETKGKIWVGELLDAESEQRFTDWRRRTESLRKTVSDDLKRLLIETESHRLRRFDSKDDTDVQPKIKTSPERNLTVKIDEFLSSILASNGNHPLIIQKLMENEVTKETVVVMNKLIPFLDDANSKITETIIWPETYFVLKKYEPFLKYDLTKMRKCCINILRENLNHDTLNIR
jgi:hypothetical protein